MRKYRRLIQSFFFLAMFIVPVLNILEIYFIKGTYISLDVGLLSISDPLAIIQAILASHELVAIMLVSAFIPLVIAMFFGSVWCSWACPYNFILDGFDWLKKKLKLKSKKPKYRASISSKTNAVRYLFLIVGLSLVSITGVPFLYLFSPPSLISTQTLLLIKYFTLTFEIVFIVAWLVMDFFLGYRVWCRYFCPTGTVLCIARTKKSLHIDYAGACSDCLACVKVCPMVLDPRHIENENLCNNCGECVDTCNARTDKALKFRLK